jgi:hypothetical protein
MGAVSAPVAIALEVLARGPVKPKRDAQGRA